jgi:hypothetical protein
MTNQDIARLAEATQQRIQGTPYQIVPTDKGFDLTLNLADAQWYGLLSTSGLTTVAIQHVECPQPGAYTVSGDEYRLQWTAGVPRLGVKMQSFKGTKVGVERKIVIGFNDQGQLGKVVDYTFRPQEGRQFVEDAAASLGLRKLMDKFTKIGLWAAAGGLAVAAIAVVLALTLAL